MYLDSYQIMLQSPPPLRLLTRQDTPWKWEQEEQRALDKLKEALVGDQVMSYFDPRKKTEIIVDASPAGLGGLLVQEGRVLSYGSRALSDVESRYSQTEREMLAVVWAWNIFICMFMVPSSLSSLITSPSLLFSRTTSKLHRELKGGNFDSCPMIVS